MVGSIDLSGEIVNLHPRNIQLVANKWENKLNQLNKINEQKRTDITTLLIGYRAL